jgi:hypothetical protein
MVKPGIFIWVVAPAMVERRSGSPDESSEMDQKTGPTQGADK